MNSIYANRSSNSQKVQWYRIQNGAYGMKMSRELNVKLRPAKKTHQNYQNFAFDGPCKVESVEFKSAVW